MKRCFSLLCLLWFLALPSLAQELYTADELDDLVGPVALYPDPLLTNVLTGSTQPEQIKQAQAYLNAGKPVSEKMDTGFDSAVNALLYYPDVLAMLDENFEWTSAIGWATANQLSDVMEAVQRFRLKARTAGNLKSDDKLNVIEEGTVIRIEPANPEVIYVPMYEPQTIIVRQTNPAPILTYSAAIATNILLWNRVFNWHSYGCYPTPYGWRPAAGYYRPYGWQGSNIYRGNVWAPNRTVNINRPVTYNRNTINNINYRGGGNNIRVNRPAAGVGNRPAQRPANRVTPRSNPGVSRPSPVTNRRPGQRPPVASPQRPATRPSANARPTTRPNRPTTRPSSGNAGRGMSNYSRTGGTVRSSQRGASSRGSRSYSGGGDRSSSGGGRSGGGRRR